MIRRIKVKHIRSQVDWDMVVRIVEGLKSGCLKPSVSARPVVHRISNKNYKILTGSIEILDAMLKDLEFIVVEVDNVGKKL